MASVAALLWNARHVPELCSGYPRTERTSVLPNRCTRPVCDGCPLLSSIRELEVSEEVVSISETLQLLALAVYSSSSFFLAFLSDICFIYVSNVIPFPRFPFPL